MRSRLEARVAAQFDAECMDWTYEPICFADETGQYLPDFVIHQAHFTCLYVEVKPPVLGPVLLEVQKKMEVIWQSEPEAGLSVISARPDGDTANLYMTTSVSHRWVHMVDDWPLGSL